MSYQTNVYPENKVNLLAWFLFSLSMFISFNCYSSNQWQELSPGLEYQDLQGGILNPWSHVYVFRIDLSKNKLALITAKKLAQKNASADQFGEFSKALLSINGGFFDHEFKPLGLRINDKIQINPI
jgi:hypothetical protein